MRPTRLLIVALLALTAVEVLAQETPPATLELPAGARVRLRTRAAPDGWLEGVLARADSSAISVIPREAPPLGASPLRLPSDSVTRLEVLTGKKRQWLPGLIIGAAVGVAMGVDEKVDPVQCQYDEYTFCSRGAAVAAMTASAAFLGTLVGSAIKTDVWTAVPLDGLVAPASGSPRVRAGVQVVRDGVGAELSVSF